MLKVRGWRTVYKKFQKRDSSGCAKVEKHLALYKSSYIPNIENVFKAFELCKFKNIKVVILGQDPYPNRQNAMGLSFSVNKGVRVPPSLVNIFKEIQRSLRITIDTTNGDLTAWTHQGVLLMNTALSVIEGSSESLMEEWMEFTEFMISHISSKLKGIVFMLWGSKATAYKGLIKNPQSHLILEAGHPSPLNRKQDFIGCDHFAKCNKYLKQTGREEVDWSV